MEREIRTALRWFEDPERALLYRRFQETYLARPRRLFLEIAKTLPKVEVRSILEIGCGSGEGLEHLKAQIPNAYLIGLDPSEEMLATKATLAPDGIEVQQVEFEDFAWPGGFDLIVSYSNFRFWREPQQSLKKIERLLNPGGAAYVLDILRDPGAGSSIYDDVLSTIEEREFFCDQLRSAYSSDEMKQIISSANLTGARFGTGGIGGFDPYGAEVSEWIGRNPRVLDAILDLGSMTLNSSKMGAFNGHLIVQKEI